MSHTPRDQLLSWSLEIFRMSSLRRQQRTLQAFERIGMPGVHVLGVVRGDDLFMVIDSDSLVEEIRSRRIVMSIDPSAVRVQSAGSRLHRNCAQPDRSVKVIGRRDAP